MTRPPLDVAALLILAERIERRAAHRRAARPTPIDRAEFERFRRRDYDAVKRAKRYRAQAAALLKRQEAAARAALDLL